MRLIFNLSLLSVAVIAAGKYSPLEDLTVVDLICPHDTKRRAADDRAPQASERRRRRKEEMKREEKEWAANAPRAQTPI